MDWVEDLLLHKHLVRILLVFNNNGIPCVHERHERVLFACTYLYIYAYAEIRSHGVCFWLSKTLAHQPIHLSTDSESFRVKWRDYLSPFI